jgi:hypothetical protein
MDALLLERLALEDLERRGMNVTVWRRGLWLRYELVSFQFRCTAESSCGDESSRLSATAPSITSPGLCSR